MQLPGPIDKDLAEWNNKMYGLHPTPYKEGFAATIQKHRVRTVFNLARLKQGESLLELGCESGQLLLESPRETIVTGADISSLALADAEILFRSNNRKADWLQVDAMQPLPFERGKFDVIVCSEMLEHVHSPALVLEQIAKICTQDTRVIVTVPIEAPKVFIKSVLSRLGLLNFFFPNIEEGQSEWHLQIFSKSLLIKLARDHFHTLEIRNVWGCHLVASLKLRETKPN